MSTRCCVPVNANNGPGSPPDVVLSLQLWSYVSGRESRERGLRLGERALPQPCTGGLFHSGCAVRVDRRRGLFHTPQPFIRRVDYRLKTTVGHAVVAARSRTGADCCNLYRSLATRTPGRGTGERTEESTRRDSLAATQQPCTGGLFHSPRPSVRDPISQCCERIVPAGFR